MLRWMILAGAAIVLVTPVTAQRYDPAYPACLQRWGQAGATTIDCSYSSLDQCRATASGLSATCYANPYWPQAHQASRGSTLGKRRVH